MTIKLEEHDHEALSLHRHSVVLKNLHTENGMIQGYAGESAVISVMIASPLFTMALATVFTLIICFVIAWKVRLFVGYNFIDLLPPFSVLSGCGRHWHQQIISTAMTYVIHRVNHIDHSCCTN